MSRYVLQPKPDKQNVVCATVGWDRPLQTFFAQVFFCTEGEPDEGEALIWVGTKPGELLSADGVIALIAPHVDVFEDLADRLTADMHATAGFRDGPHQTAVKRTLFGSIH